MNDKNFFERAIEFFSPNMAGRREAARFHLGEVRELIATAKQKKYDAANMGKRTDWRGANGASVNTENFYALHLLRARSRHLVQNNYWARKAIKVITNHTVGIGIMPNFSAGTDAQKKRLQSVFEDWTEIDNCDWQGLHDFRGIQKLVMRTVAESGECIIRKRRIKAKPGQVPIQLQIQEPDVIDTSKDGILLENGFIIQGVEFNDQGKRVAYWLYDQHPGETLNFSLQSRRIPATDVIHVFEVLRAGQVRGIPFGVSAMVRLKDFDDYEDAQIMRQKIAACFTAFVTSETKATLMGAATPGGAKARAEAERMRPGMIEYLNPGEEITFAAPPAVPEYSTFSKNVLLGIAAAYDITYESLTGDLSGSNFSSSRMGWLEMAQNVYDWQYQLMIPTFLQRVWRWFYDASVVGGLVREGGGCKWTAPRRQMFDPYKETQAKILAQQAGYTSWSETVREDGWDPKELAEEIEDEREMLDEKGLLFAGDPRNAAKGAGTPPADEETQPAKPTSGGQPAKK